MLLRFDRIVGNWSAGLSRVGEIEYDKDKSSAYYRFPPLRRETATFLDRVAPG